MVYGLSFELGIKSSILHLTILLLNMVLIIKRQTAGVHASLVGKMCEHFISYQILKFERPLTSAGRLSQIISYQILKFAQQDACHRYTKIVTLVCFVYLGFRHVSNVKSIC